MYLKVKIVLRRAVRRFPLAGWMEKVFRFHYTLKGILEKQLSFKNGNGMGKTKGNSRKILITQLDVSFYSSFQMFILAKALQLRNADIKLLICGSVLDGCTFENVNNQHEDVCLNCRFNEKYTLPMFGLDVIKLEDYLSRNDMASITATADKLICDYPQEYIYKGIDIISITNDSVVRYFYGAVPEEEDTLKRIRRQHLISSMIGADVSQAVDSDYKPDIVLSYMFVYSTWEPYIRYFEKKKNIDLLTFSVSNFNLRSMILNNMNLYNNSERFQKYVQSREHKYLTIDEKQELEAFFKDRTTGNAQFFKLFNYFDKKSSNVSDVLSIDDKKRNIFLFPNVFWDVGIHDMGQLYENVIQWVLGSIELMKNREDCCLYIKPHPAEVYDSAPSLKSVMDHIEERFPELPSNIKIIRPELKIKPYDLFPFIDVGVIFNGTIGLEMLLGGISVVVAGKAPYGGMGFTNDPQMEEEYKKILVGDIEIVKPDKREVSLFAYFYFIKTSIPWNLTQRVYADNFKGYTFSSLDDIMPGKNKYLDHICNCILDKKNTVFEDW